MTVGSGGGGGGAAEFGGPPVSRNAVTAPPTRTRPASTTASRRRSMDRRYSAPRTDPVDRCRAETRWLWPTVARSERIGHFGQCGRSVQLHHPAATPAELGQLGHGVRRVQPDHELVPFGRGQLVERGPA